MGQIGFFLCSPLERKAPASGGLEKETEKVFFSSVLLFPRGSHNVADRVIEVSREKWIESFPERSEEKWRVFTSNFFAR